MPMEEGELYDEDLNSIAREIHANDWKNLAIYLGFKRAQISHIEADNPRDILGQIFAMLSQWRNKLECHVNQRKALCEALTRTGNRLLAARLSGVAPLRSRSIQATEPNTSSLRVKAVHAAKIPIVQIRYIRPRKWNPYLTKPIKAWYYSGYNDEVQEGENNFYFHCLMTDRSGFIIYTSFFFPDFQEAKEVYDLVHKSDVNNPVQLSCLKVEKQKKRYKQKGMFKRTCRLIFNEKSKISVWPRKSFSFNS
ncbi:uncharacterized protein LOC110988558 [Acanthaster planci]|uniref:Uncharacterized protein LOC110988558 n=1 Tax=Acanthaster planci TaxID=133434 RepID=A0A8B7ZST3_ACAPL|nr:uncharacterized protein LOC110988558 [Acanthaster planci]